MELGGRPREGQDDARRRRAKDESEGVSHLPGRDGHVEDPYAEGVAALPLTHDPRRHAKRIIQSAQDYLLHGVTGRRDTDMGTFNQPQDTPTLHPNSFIRTPDTPGLNDPQHTDLGTFNQPQDTP